MYSILILAWLNIYKLKKFSEKAIFEFWNFKFSRQIEPCEIGDLNSMNFVLLNIDEIKTFAIITLSSLPILIENIYEFVKFELINYKLINFIVLGKFVFAISKIASL